MGKVGCLGDIAFVASSRTVRTITKLVLSGSARYGEHKKHLGNTLTEFEGLDPETATFDIELSMYLGVNPVSDINKIAQYERGGKTLPLVLGSRKYGRYRWTITSHKVKGQTFDGRGNLTGATVSLNLLEYVKS